MKITLFIVLLTSLGTLAQIKNTIPVFYFAPEYNKNEVLNHSKSALIASLGSTETITKVEIYPLSGNGGNEVSALRYKCSERQEQGIVLGFYGRYTTVASQPYSGHAFKVFNQVQSNEFLNKIEEVFVKQSKYLKDDTNNNNIFFRFDDINVIVTTYSIRLLWNGFDSILWKSSFDEAKKEFDKAQK